MNPKTRQLEPTGLKMLQPEALPREVTVGPTGELSFSPVKELEKLRKADTKATVTGVTLGCGETALFKDNTGRAVVDLGHAVELQAQFAVSSQVVARGGVTVGVRVLMSPDTIDTNTAGLDVPLGSTSEWTEIGVAIGRYVAAG